MHVTRSNESYDWAAKFRVLYEKARGLYEGGNHDAKSYFSKEEVEWLASIGCRPAEMYDFAEDYPEIDCETALLITSARRDYFLHVMKGEASAIRVEPGAFPPKREELAGIPWLPRIILKAKAKLRGEMPDSLMFCCGGDRHFLRNFDIHPADFLRLVWGNWEDEEKVVEYVKSRQIAEPVHA